mmetsp:Transcript_26508/g.43348  ORF Transcript_26508/g.43348 Transcript_26508/m.43348 type:complete len:373 (-) Transcript_26508:105-1223(-)
MSNWNFGSNAGTSNFSFSNTTDDKKESQQPGASNSSSSSTTTAAAPASTFSWGNSGSSNFAFGGDNNNKNTANNTTAAASNNNNPSFFSLDNNAQSSQPQQQQQQQQQKQQHKDDEDVDGCRHVPHVDAKNLNREILDVDKHAHKLVYVSRTDCDFVICDCCDKQFVGASWHCAKQCDFDVCEDCVCVSELSIEVASDAHIEQYNQQPALLKQIEQRDQNVMRIAAFSREVDRKRKRNEKKLKLMQLETKTQQPQKRKLPAIKTTDKEQEQDEDKNIKQSEPEENEDNVVDVATGDIDLSQIADIEQLKACGLEALKKDLQCYGLKCGGTLQERAERLFLLKHSKLNTLPKHCFATKKKKSHKPPAKKRQKL